MLKDKIGNRLYRTVKVKINFPDEIFPTRTLVQHAGPRQGFNSEGIDSILLSTADQLETLYPFWEFKFIELAPEGRTARYVFNFAGYRPTPPQNPQPQSSTSLGPAPEASSTPTEVGDTLVAPPAGNE